MSLGLKCVKEKNYNIAGYLCFKMDLTHGGKLEVLSYIHHACVLVTSMSGEICEGEKKEERKREVNVFVC